ncbi:MAG: repeat-containing protein [Chitinophagaceae bacterium]|nr:repeat-containing protein [Chitinophagaceae bacterium]
MKKVTTITLGLLFSVLLLKAQSLTQFADKGKWGYKNEAGKIIVPAKYTEVSDFRKGFAAVLIGGKWGLININGKIVIPILYDYLPIDRLNNGMIPFALTGPHHGGILDTSGVIIVPPVYDACKMAGKNIFIVSKNNLFGVYNISDAYHNYDVKTKVAQYGQMTIPLGFSGITVAITDKMQVIDNLLRVTLTDKSGKTLNGLYNYDGMGVLPCEYETVGLFHDGKAVVSKNGQRFNIDTNGTIVD